MSLDFADLHDATLESIEVRWSQGEVIVALRTGDAMHPRQDIVGEGLQRVVCARALPWGPSASVNEVRGPTSHGSGTLLEIEMQSGDVIGIEAARFERRRVPKR